MVITYLKNIIAVLSFAIFIVFFAISYKEHIARFDLGIDKTEILDKEVAKEESKEDPFKNNGILDPYYTKENINIENILKAKDDDVRKKLVYYLNKFVNEDFIEIYGPERLAYIKYYDDGILIIGDSQVEHFRTYGVLEQRFVAAFPGYNLNKQMAELDKVLTPKVKKCVLWNGYNIASYKDADEFVNTYQVYVNKIKEYNPNIKVYVCSLLPATDEAINKDLNGEVVHKLYNGREYDKALEKYFGKTGQYINISFLVKQHYYGNDGVHFMQQFYYMLAPYIAYYLNLNYEEAK